MFRYQILIEYVGSNFRGWQVQTKGKTVQGLIQEKISKLLKEKIIVTGSGRTDSGVHAINQVANFHINNQSTINMIGLKNKLNSILYKYIKIKACERVKDDFHSQYDCKEKVYMYRIKINSSCSVFEEGRFWFIKRGIDINKIKKVTSLFVGKIDFQNLCKVGYSGETTIRNLKRISVKQKGDYIDLVITGNGFLRGMVRLIVGCLINYEKGLISKKDIGLALKNKKKLKLNYSAPAEGLYLYKVKY